MPDAYGDGNEETFLIALTLVHLQLRDDDDGGGGGGGDGFGGSPVCRKVP
jgi:hypothetical protein